MLCNKASLLELHLVSCVYFDNHLTDLHAVSLVAVSVRAVSSDVKSDPVNSLVLTSVLSSCKAACTPGV